ncbi:hypothetical protein [Amycolatopsis viridis]|uniref:Uncharacterized protein n=1 Tax=Amycolatopsis viridis TaxID=185678 RepID=A0ABX0SS28_9PSEU|nr:hypothetical protein [Amycolatopsis viridis]NIH79758.1 hypothetical protein [Amycolatopsis viridis]
MVTSSTENPRGPAGFCCAGRVWRDGRCGTKTDNRSATTTVGARPRRASTVARCSGAADHRLAGKELVRVDNIAGEPLPRVPGEPEWEPF